MGIKWFHKSYYSLPTHLCSALHIMATIKLFSVSQPFFPYSAIKLIKCQSIHSTESDCGKMLPFQPGGLSGFTQQQRWISTPNTWNHLGNTKSSHCIKCKCSVPTTPAPPEHVLPVRVAGEGRKTTGHAHNVRA